VKYRSCRHCGDSVPHDAPVAICSRCACLPVAERGRPREPGADDDRQPTRCGRCGLVGSGELCPRCQDKLTGELAAVSSQPSTVSSQQFLNAESCPLIAPDASTLRAQLLEAGRRREYVWLAGRADLLRRCATFGPMARAQPR
jgi:hypothetical protein